MYLPHCNMLISKSLLVLFLLSKDFTRTFNWDPDDLTTPTGDEGSINPLSAAQPETPEVDFDRSIVDKSLKLYEENRGNAYAPQRDFMPGGSSNIQGGSDISGVSYKGPQATNGQEQPRRDIVHLTHPRASVASQPLSTAPTQHTASDTTLSSQYPAQLHHQQPEQPQTVSAPSQPNNLPQSLENIPLTVTEYVDSAPSSPNSSQDTVIDNSLLQEYIPPIVRAGVSGYSSGTPQNQISGDSDDTDDNASQTDIQSDESSSDEGRDISGPSNINPPSKIRIRIVRPESGTRISKGSRQTGSDELSEPQYEIEPQDYVWKNESLESQQTNERAQTDTDATSEVGDTDDDTEPETIDLNSLSPIEKYRKRMTILANEAVIQKLHKGNFVEGMPSTYRDLLLYARQMYLQGFKKPVIQKGKRLREESDTESLNPQENANKYAAQSKNHEIIKLMALEAERLGLPKSANENSRLSPYHAVLMDAYNIHRKRLNRKAANIRKLRSIRRDQSRKAQDAT